MAIVFFITALLVALASANPQDGYEYPRPERPFGEQISSGQQPFPQFQQPSTPTGYEYNKPVQITPVQPQPVRPQPIQPQPVRPQPIQPQPVRPQPIQPQPTRPQPQPIRPQPIQPQPVRPQPVQPKPIQPQPVRPQPVQPQPLRPQPVQPKPVQPQPVRPQPIKPQPQFEQQSTPTGYDYSKPVQQQPIPQQIPQQIPQVQPQPLRPQPVQPRPIQPQPVRPQPVQPQQPRPQPVQPQQPRPQPAQPQQPRPQQPRPQPVQPRPIQPQPVRPQPIQQQPTRPQPTQPQPRPQPQLKPQPAQPSVDGYEYPVPAEIFQERPSGPSSAQFVQAKKPTSPAKTAAAKKAQQEITQQRINIGGFTDISSTTPTRISLDIPSRNEYSVQVNKQQTSSIGYTQAPIQENRFGVTTSQSEGQQIFQTTGPSSASLQTTFTSQSAAPSQTELTDISTDYSFDVPSQELQDLYQQVVFNIPPKKPAQSAQLTTQTQGAQQQKTTVLTVKPTQGTTSAQPANYQSGYQSAAPLNVNTETRFDSGVSQGFDNNQYNGPAQQQISAYTPAQNFQQQSFVSQQQYQIQPQPQYQQQQVQFNTVQAYQPAVVAPVVAEVYTTNLQYSQPPQIQAYQQAVVPLQTFSAVNYQQPLISIPQQTSFNNFAGQVSNFQQQLPASIQSVSYQQSRPSKVSVEQVASIGYDYPLPAIPFNSGGSSNYEQQSSSNQAVFAQQPSGYNYLRPSRSIKSSAYDYPADSGNSPSYIYRSSVTGNAAQLQEPQQQVTYQVQYPETQKIQPAYYQTSYQYAYQQPQVSYQYEYKLQPNQYQQVTTYQTQPSNYQIKAEQKFIPYQLETVVANPILTYTYSTPVQTSSEHIASQGFQSQIVNTPIQTNIISSSSHQKQTNVNDFDISESPTKTLASLDPDLLETIQSLLLKEEIQINNKEKKNAPTENVPFDSYGVPINQKTVVGVALESFQPAVIVGHLPKPQQTGDYDTEPITVYGPPTRH